jgi:hypothetical protein
LGYILGDVFAKSSGHTGAAAVFKMQRAAAAASDEQDKSVLTAINSISGKKLN